MQEENSAETPQQGEFEGHTPGEWFVTENPLHLAEGYCIPDIKATHPDYALDIATCYGSGLSDENNRANARLIAAAPRLLRERNEARALLEETIIYVEECEQYHKPQCRTLSKRIKALLARIEGGAS